MIIAISAGGCVLVFVVVSGVICLVKLKVRFAQQPQDKDFHEFLYGTAGYDIDCERKLVALSAPYDISFEINKDMFNIG